MPFFYGFDLTYLVIVLPCIILSLIASARVNSTFKKYSRQISSRRLTGAQAAERVLLANGVRGVRIERISGNLTDHYDPKSNVIRLSDNVYDNPSTAAIGVACHEADRTGLGIFIDIVNGNHFCPATQNAVGILRQP